MKGKYLFEKNDGYLRLDVTGRFDKSELLLFPEIVLNKCKKENIYKVLFNGLELSGTDLPTVDRFIIGEKYAELISMKLKLAVVWPKEHIDNIFQTVANNRMSRTRVFPDQKAGIKWLLDKD